MPDNPCLLAIDQGTTSSRAIVFNTQGQIITSAQQEFTQHYPNEGWVEHDPEEIWSTTLATAQKALQLAAQQGYHCQGIGITNQRETTVVWDKATGEPIYNAIVWQDRRTTEFCQALKAKGLEDTIQAKTGLLVDPYFSASKIKWILDNVEGARARADRGELLFGTVDTFLIYRLTGGRSHKTDATNASRTSLYNIHQGQWDEELLEMFNIPRSVLPEVCDCVTDFGTTTDNLFDQPLTIWGVAGDQQAATIGQCCFEVGDIKSTYGTGCFVMMNTGHTAITSTSRLLTTLAYQLNGKPTYAIEGSIFVAGAAVQWLRDELKIIEHAADTEAIAQSIDSTGGVYLVPAFTGLGAPWWDPEARGAIFGLTRGAGRAEITRATLESIAYQTTDLLAAMANDGIEPATIKVDGGMVANNWLMQFLSDVTNTQVLRPQVLETTARGAAYLAGIGAGIYQNFNDVRANWSLDQTFSPDISDQARENLMNGWTHSVMRLTEG